MKLFTLALFTLALQAQTTINIGTVTVPTEVATATEQWRLGQFKAFTTTLTAGVGGAATSLSVASSAGIAAGDQILIDTEALNVTAKNGTLTVTRGATITTAAPHANGSTVRVIKWPTGVAMLKVLLRDKVNEILAQQKPATITTLETEIATRQAQIEAYKGTTVE